VIVGVLLKILQHSDQDDLSVDEAGRPFGRSTVPRAGWFLYKFPSETDEISHKEKCHFLFPIGRFRSKIRFSGISLFFARSIVPIASERAGQEGVLAVAKGLLWATVPALQLVSLRRVIAHALRVTEPLLARAGASELLGNSRKPFGNILGNTGNIRGDTYPQTLRNSMKPFGNILGNAGNIRGGYLSQNS